MAKIDYKMMELDNTFEQKKADSTPPADDNEVIIFRNVSKQFKLYKDDKQRFLGLFFKKAVKYKSFLALDNVSFTIRRGECIGILGRNGAGKSTMLKVVTGVCYPSAGAVFVRGQVSALLELTAGFDPEMTGRENIYLRGYIMGLNKRTLQDLEQTIIDFSELGDFIDQPLRTYSSGMRARLGFAVNANINPDILVIDEALSVGDASFSRKCKKKIDEIVKAGATVLFVSHSIDAIRSFCEKCMLMEKGKLVFTGDTEQAIAEYQTKYNG